MLRPFILKGQIDSWPAMKWTPETISKALGDKKLRARLGLKKQKAGTILWETDSIYVDVTLEEFLNWIEKTEGDRMKGQLEDYNPDEHWAYIDYKYMFEMFEDDEDLNAVDWGQTFGCGLDGRDGVDSTFWLGTKGAYTPCHYDTYGFNLVAQIYGKKRWILFPPDDDLKPTRLPYEESSVFSSFDFISPNPHLLPHTHPHLITLEPGDVLFVPPKWWHFVQSVSELTISINTWVDTPHHDKAARPLEALTQTIMSLVTSGALSNEISKFVIGHSNSTSHSSDIHSNLEILNSLISMEGNGEMENVIMDDFVKRWRSQGVDVPAVDGIENFARYLIENCVLDVMDGACDGAHSKEVKRTLEITDLISVLTHPDVVKLVYDRLCHMTGPK